ncbi:two-component system response regulator BtsR [Veronia pacifica]|uniref:Two-component system response regulator YehT n=1 Tax=Veronia pacifica TaxID=1080227 RepID=A0A1C3EA69_9GAMM|nr:two-component system response regulator BtsR [Veronia pacifica]ODA30133.1 two-component system response regulator YehT [Veronia pacifica]
MLNALIIDDEPYAREELSELLAETGKVNVIGQCTNALEGLKTIHKLKPDVVFLDIQMPRITGLEMLAMLDPETMPHVVFVTAYDDFAIQAFEDNAFDYLLKPVESHRLDKTIQRLNRHIQKPVGYDPVMPDTLKLLPCAGHNRVSLVPQEQVEYAHSGVSGIEVVTAQGASVTQLSLKVMEDRTPMIRCHRQYLVQPIAIRELRYLENGLAELVTASGHNVPVSRRHLKALKDELGLN